MLEEEMVGRKSFESKLSPLSPPLDKDFNAGFDFDIGSSFIGAFLAALITCSSMLLVLLSIESKNEKSTFQD